MYERRPAADGAIREPVPLVLFDVVPPSRMENLPDEALLAAVGLGEPHAATVFVRRFQRKVFGLALAITQDASLAEDVAQTAFERAWHHAGAYDARRAGVATWLLTITRNLAIDVTRVRKPVPVDPAFVAEMVWAATTPDPAEAAIAKDRLSRLRASLGDLPDEQRRAVLLATIACRTSAEIAAMEGVPVPTAKHRIQSGLRKLRRSVEEETHDA